MTSVRKAPRYLGVAGLAAALTLLSACGSSSKTLSAPSTPKATSAAATPTGTQASVAASVPAGGGTDRNSKFCQLAKAEQDQSTKLASKLTSGDPATLKTFIQQAVSALPAFEAAAPDSIKSSVQALVSVDNQLYATLKADNYDFTKAGPAVQKLISDPKFSADEMNVTNYLTTGCGIVDQNASATAKP